VRLEQKEYTGEELLLREALAGYAAQSSASLQRHCAKRPIGANLAGQGRFAKAEPLLLDGCCEKLKE
jgi:hypothetical protein